MTATDFTLHLHSADDLFQASGTSPLSPGWRNRSGVDELLAVWFERSPTEPGRLTSFLPPDQIAPDLTAQVRSVWLCYLDVMIDEQEAAIRVIRKVAGRSALLGLLVLGIFLAASAVAGNLSFLPEWLSSLLSEGFIVAGWVGAWRPAELYLYEWRPYRARRKFYEYAKTMDLTIAPADQPSPVLVIVLLPTLVITTLPLHKETLPCLFKSNDAANSPTTMKATIPFSLPW